MSHKEPIRLRYINAKSANDTYVKTRPKTMAAAIFTAQTDFIKLFSLTTKVPSLHELNHRFHVFYTTDDT